MMNEWPHVNVVIVPDPSDQAHVAIMKFVLEGEGSILPPGAAWISQHRWIRPPDPALIEERIQKWRQLDSGAPRPQPLRWYIAKSGDVPTDRTYRNGQVSHATEARVVHDMALCKELHRDLLRADRTERLLELDAQWMAATREKDDATVTDIDAEKSVLLDATDDPRIEAAQTIEDLKAVTLDDVLSKAQASGRFKSARTVAVNAVP